MGTTIRKDGHWWRITVHQHGKRECWLYSDRKVAEIKAKEYNYRLAMEGWGFWKRHAGETFGTYAEKQMILWEQGILKASTTKRWRQSLDLYLLTTFGNRPLEEKTRAELKDFFSILVKKGLRRYTILNVLALLRRILQEAVEESRLTANPASGLGRHVLPRGEQPFISTALTPREAKHLLKICQEAFPKYYPLLFCLLQTGLRPGEALALEWSDLNFANSTITVRGTLFEGNKTVPKNGRIHQVKMTPLLKKCLVKLREVRKLEAGYRGWPMIPTWVFCNGAALPLDLRSLKMRWWYKVVEQASLPRIRLHDLRATVVSLLLNEGLTPWEVQAYIGHRSLVMTCNTYAHRYPGSRRIEEVLAKLVSVKE